MIAQTASIRTTRVIKSMILFPYSGRPDLAGDSTMLCFPAKIKQVSPLREDRNIVKVPLSPRYMRNNEPSCVRPCATTDSLYLSMTIRSELPVSAQTIGRFFQISDASVAGDKNKTAIIDKYFIALIPYVGFLVVLPRRTVASV